MNSTITLQAVELLSLTIHNILPTTNYTNPTMLIHWPFGGGGSLPVHKLVTDLTSHNHYVKR